MKEFFDLGLPYEMLSFGAAGSIGLGSKSRAVYLGLKVLPMNFSPDGDLGGVCPLGDI